MSDYWKERFSRIEQQANDKSTEYLQELDGKYRNAISEIDKQINAWYQRFAKNNEIDMTEARRLLKSAEFEELRWDVKEYIKRGRANAVDAAWMKELENASAKFHINRLEALKLHVRQQVEVMLGGMPADVQSVLQDVYTDTFYHACYELQKGVGIGFDVSKLDDKKVAEILSKPWAADGSDFSDKVWRNKQQLVYTLDQELSRMVLTGEPPKKAIAGIRKACDASNYQAKRLVMTEQAYFTSKAQEKAFNELDVERYEVLSSMDKNVCKLCGEMDKKVFAMQDFQVGVTAPPFHPFCRCVTAPYFDDEFAKGKRFARDAKGKTVQIDSKITFEEWKKQFVEPKMAAGDSAGSEDSKRAKPKLLKKLESMDEDMIESTLREYEEQIADSDIENAVVITRNGKVFQCYGTKNAVYPNIDLGDEVRGAYVTHNHPVGSVNEYSFSKDDINLFVDSNLQVLRGIDERYIYVLTRNPEELDEHVSIFEIDEFNSRHDEVISAAEKLGIGYRRYLRE